jgi:glutamate/tyrosine decarboxylase-like PLP-dependent enzyme
MQNSEERVAFENAVRTLMEGFANLPGAEEQFDYDAIGNVLQQTAERLRDNYPYQHPLYAGQMLKPPHPVARLAYALAMIINPNNHALDGGRASSVMEKEAVARLGQLFGWGDALGHLCGGGTIANLEALWVAGRSRPGKTLLGSELAHYTHARLTDVLGLPYESIPADDAGVMDLGALEMRLRQGDIGTVVVTIGTTALGSLDPITEILELQQRYGFRIHADAAYGGYFGLASELNPEIRAIYDALTHADSLVIDPHKHGLQPYGCGCVLFRDPAVGRFYKHDSPYTYFSSAELHLGEISLECSRPGASAVALWATQQLLPMIPGGEFARSLDACLRAAREFWKWLDASADFVPLLYPPLDIVVYVPVAKSASEASGRARRIFEKAASADLHLALARMPDHIVRNYYPALDFDADSVTCLRSCLMKPAHEAWIPEITKRLSDSA